MFDEWEIQDRLARDLAQFFQPWHKDTILPASFADKMGVERLSGSIGFFEVIDCRKDGVVQRGQHS